MSLPSCNPARRNLLQSALTVTLAAQLLPNLATAAPVASGAARRNRDFDFLAGEWKIRHRRLKQLTDADWDEFEGEATVWSALDGLASIEELRIPSRAFSGMGVRVFHLDKKQWADHWVSGQNGMLNEPMMGGFVDGVGTFSAEDSDDGKPLLARGVWDRITTTSCRWHQATSRDAGKTWQPNWFMDWRRA